MTNTDKDTKPPASPTVTKDRFNQARRAILDLNLPQMPFERADLIVEVVAKEFGITVEE